MTTLAQWAVDHGRCGVTAAGVTCTKERLIGKDRCWWHEAEKQRKEATK